MHGLVPQYPSVRGNGSKLELRFSATKLINKDTFSLSDPFLVCCLVHNGQIVAEVGRTEVIQDDLNPCWTKPLLFDYQPCQHDNVTLRVDIFDSDSTDHCTLSKHDFLGRAVFSLKDVLQSPYRHLDIELQAVKKRDLSTISSMSRTTSIATTLVSTHGDVSDDERRSSSSTHTVVQPLSDLSPRESAESIAHDLDRATKGSRASKVTGFLSIYGEFSLWSPGASITFSVKSSLLRGHSSIKSAFLKLSVTQFYEIQRERHNGSASVWLCVYRSEDGANVDKDNYVHFNDAVLDECTLNNSQEKRRMRIVFYKRRRQAEHEIICYVTWSMAELLKKKVGQKEVSYPMEGLYADDVGLGSILFQRLRDDDANSDDHHLTLNVKADHFLNDRFVSAHNETPCRARRIIQPPAFFSRH